MTTKRRVTHKRSSKCERCCNGMQTKNLGKKKKECLESLKKKREAYHRVRYIVDGIEKTISLGLGIHIRRN